MGGSLELKLLAKAWVSIYHNDSGARAGEDLSIDHLPDLGRKFGEKEGGNLGVESLSDVGHGGSGGMCGQCKGDRDPHVDLFCRCHFAVLGEMKTILKAGVEAEIVKLTFSVNVKETPLRRRLCPSWSVAVSQGLWASLLQRAKLIELHLER